MVNHTAEDALQSLGYAPDAVTKIKAGTSRRTARSRAPRSSSRSISPCSTAPWPRRAGRGTIPPMGHLKMLGRRAAVPLGGRFQDHQPPPRRHHRGHREDLPGGLAPRDQVRRPLPRRLQGVAAVRDRRERRPGGPGRTARPRPRAAPRRAESDHPPLLRRRPRRLRDRRACIPDGRPGRSVLPGHEGRLDRQRTDGFARDLDVDGAPARSAAEGPRPQARPHAVRTRGGDEQSEGPPAKSIPDYVARWLANEFLTEDERRAIGLEAPVEGNGHGGTSATPAAKSQTFAGKSLDAFDPSISRPGGERERRSRRRATSAVASWSARGRATPAPSAARRAAARRCPGWVATLPTVGVPPPARPGRVPARLAPDPGALDGAPRLRGSSAIFGPAALVHRCGSIDWACSARSSPPRASSLDPRLDRRGGTFLVRPTVGARTASNGTPAVETNILETQFEVGPAATRSSRSSISCRSPKGRATRRPRGSSGLWKPREGRPTSRSGSSRGSEHGGARPPAHPRGDPERGPLGGLGRGPRSRSGGPAAFAVDAGIATARRRLGPPGRLRDVRPLVGRRSPSRVAGPEPPRGDGAGHLEGLGPRPRGSAPSAPRPAAGTMPSSGPRTRPSSCSPTSKPAPSSPRRRPRSPSGRAAGGTGTTGCYVWIRDAAFSAQAMLPCSAT